MASPSCSATIRTVVNALAVELPQYVEPPIVTAARNRKLAASYERKQKEHLSRMKFTINQSSTYVAHQQRLLPNITVLQSVNGFNHTEVIAALLESGLHFHSLSNGGKKWGKLATFLTKYRALQYQVRHQLPYMLQLEEDVRPILPQWPAMVAQACSHYERDPSLTIMQLSRYSEVVITSLAGANKLLGLVQRYGIIRNDDQQLLNGHVMGSRADWPTHRGMVLLQAPHGPLPRGYALFRSTNAANGHIYRSRRITWAEMALLRLLSDPSGETRRSAWFGNPQGFDLWLD